MRSLGLAISIAALLTTSCSTVDVFPRLALDFFVPAALDDPWKRKVENWQARHSRDPAVRSEALAEKSKLGRSYDRFERDLRREVAANTMAWVQQHSRQHYRPDGAEDHWATLGEVLKSGEDDCDGLDLLTFVLLRRLGFPESQIYRAIVVEDGTEQHHMVTLWFENGRRDDPFVLDPTGVVTSKMVRLSSISNWEPIQLFDEQAQYSVRSLPTAARVSAEEAR